MVQELGHTGSLAYEGWPAYDEKLLTSSTFKLPIQVRSAFMLNSLHNAEELLLSVKLASCCGVPLLLLRCCQIEPFSFNHVTPMSP